MAYTHPQQSNVLGQPNIDSAQLPEFTFHHGHVEKVINTAEDLATFGYPVYGAPSDVSQCVLLRSTYGKDINLPSNYTKKLLLAMLPKWIALCILIYLIIWALK